MSLEIVNNNNNVSTRPLPVQNGGFVEACGLLQKEVTNLVDLTLLDSERAVEKARALRTIAENFREQVLASQSVITLDERVEHIQTQLLAQEIRLPAAYFMMKLLVTGPIQCFDGLKKEMSKTTLIFFEFVVMQCNLEERRIDKVTIEQWRADIQRVLDSLPEREVETRYNLECVKAAIQRFDVGLGKWKEVAKDHIKPFIIGLARALLTLDRPGPTTAIHVVEPVVNLIVGIYKNMETRWYENVLALRWLFSGNKIKRIEDLERMQPLMQDFDTHYPHAFCISQLFSEVFHNNHENDDLRRVVFETGKINLLDLAELNEDTKFLRRTFWQVRYITLENLSEIAEHGSDTYRTKSIQAIVRRRVDRNAEVRRRAGELISKLGPTKPQEWTEAITEFQQRCKKFSEKDRVKLLGISIQIRGLEAKKEEYETLKAEFAKPGASYQSSGPKLDKLKTLEGQMPEIEEKLWDFQEDEASLEEILRLQQIEINTGIDWKSFRTK